MAASSSASASGAHHRSRTHSPLPVKRRAGRKKFQETRHPVYKGVRQRNGKWVCEIRQPNSARTRLWVGTFESPEMAARAYDVTAVALRGESAMLNFPEPNAHGEGGGSSFASSPSSSRLSSPFSSSAVRLGLEEKNVAESDGLVLRTASFVDEEELFNMPGLLDSMAEGLMLTPPATVSGFDWDGVDVVDLTLWE